MKKIIKRGTVENGVVKGWVIDCEGESIDLDEMIQFGKIHKKV